MDRPNILVFIPHDLGDHLGCYGHRDVESPNLDGLAKRGIRFDNYFTAAPECTPSRAGMMTGQYTHQNGLMGLCHRGWEFSENAVHLSAMLEDSGYRSILFGLQHETYGEASRLGYSEHRSTENRDAASVCAEVEKFLGEVSRGKQKPWFACVGFHDVHRPWPEPSEGAPALDPGSVDLPKALPDTPEVRMDYARFNRYIREMDRSIGGVLDKLESTGRMKDTVVIFTTDHGSPFPRAKSTYFDAGIRIPLIVSHPEAEGNDVSRELLSNIDFAPTILELTGSPSRSEIEGRSFAPLLTGGPYEERDAIYGALYYDAYYDPIHCVRTKRIKYIRSFAVTSKDAKGADPEVLAKHETGSWIRADDSDVQNSDSWRVLLSSAPKGRFPAPPPEELYDLTSDQYEEENLLSLGKKESSKGGLSADEIDRIAESMRKLLDEMMHRTESPLLDGHVSPDLSSTRNQRIVSAS